MDQVADAMNRGVSLGQVVKTLREQEGGADKVVYARGGQASQFISRPVTVRGAVPTGQVQERILSPQDFDPHSL